MDESRGKDRGSLPLSRVIHVDEACLRFEAACQAGPPPRIEDFLDEASGAERAALLTQLILLEVIYRRRCGEAPSPEEYRIRYPDLDPVWLQDALAPEPHVQETTGYAVVSERGPLPQEGPERVVKPVGRLVGDYELLEKVAKGGMGVVYKARHVKLDRIVALKMVLAGAHADALHRTRFRIEAEAVARLQHPHIVQIYEVGEVDGQPFFSMEFVEGGSLANRLDGAPWQGRPAADLMRLLAQAMHYAHQRGVLHRDLKPANVLLTPAGAPKVTDFGLAKNLDEEAGLSRSGDIMGTPSYMAPEQADGRIRDLGPWTDVYALGAILYELLTGRPPFKGNSVMETLEQVRRLDPTPPRQLRSRTPLDLETICLKCLRKETAGRYQAAGDLEADLARFLRGEPILARPVGPIERAVKWARRRPTAATLVAVVVLAMVAAAAAVPWHIVTLHAEVAAAKADVIRLRDQEQADQDGRRRAEIRADAQRWLSEGQEVLARPVPRANDLDDARVLFAKAANRIDEADATADPALRELKEEAGRRLADVERGRDDRAAAAKAGADFKQFFDLRDEAFFQLYRDAFAGPDSASPAASREAARKALALLGLDPERPGAPSLGAYDAAKKERLVAGLYEVLLLLAEATARPLPDQPAAERQRQAHEALRILDRAAELAPAARTALRRRARYLEQLGGADAAAKERARADAAAPNTALDWFLTGFDRGQEGGDPRLAVADLDRAIRLQPDLFWAQLFRSVYWEKLKNPAEARAGLTVCIRERPDFIWTYLLRGFLYGQSADAEDFKAAEEDFASAEKLHPDASARYVIHANRGVLALREGKLDRAVEDFQKAVDLKPDAYPAYLDLAEAYQQQSDPDKALAALDEAMRVDPKSPTPWRARARLHLLRKEETAALADYDKAVRLQSAAPPTTDLAADQLERGRILYRMKNYEEAIRACQAVQAVRDDSPRAYRLQGEAQIQLKRYKEAVACFDRCVELTKARPDAGAYWDRGLARMELNDSAGAADDYTQALALGPSAADRRKLHVARGWAYLTAEAPRLALHDFDEVVRGGGPHDEEAEAYDGRGQARVKLGYCPAAVADAEECVRLAPDAPRLLYNAGRIYAQVVGLMDGGAGTAEGLPPAVRGYFQGRADALLRAALERTPAAERASFWRKYVQVDPAWNAVRRSLEFARLADDNGGPGK